MPLQWLFRLGLAACLAHRVWASVGALFVAVLVGPQGRAGQV